MEFVFVTTFFFNVGPVVKEIVYVVDCSNKCVDTLISEGVSVSEFGSDQEGVHILVFVRLSERLSQYSVPLVVKVYLLNFRALL